MDPFAMVVVIVFMSLVAGTIHKFLDVWARNGKRQGDDRAVLHAVEGLRAEIAALKQHETEAVLSFDSTLQTLDSRLKHLEQRGLGPGAAQPAVPATRQPAEEPVAVRVGERSGGDQVRAA